VEIVFTDRRLRVGARIVDRQLLRLPFESGLERAPN